MSSGGAASKSSEAGAAAPIDPLLAEHADAIAALAAAVPELAALDKTVFPFYDEIWLLRFVLSFTDAADRIEAVGAAIQFRATPAYQDMFARVNDGTWRSSEMIRKAKRYTVGGVMPAELNTTTAGGPLVLVRGKYGDPAPLLAHFSLDEIKLIFFSFREAQLVINDAKTRETRRLSKSIFLMDMSGATMGAMMNRKMRGIQSAVSAISAKVYPQMMMKLVMLNAPSWISIVMAVMTRLLPVSMTSKIYICQYPAVARTATTTTAESGGIGADPFVAQHLNVDALPKFIGGNLDDSLVPDDISGELYVGMEGAGAQTKLAVPRGSKVATHCPVCGGTEDELVVVEYEISLEARGVYYSAAYVACDEATLAAIEAAPDASGSAAAEKAYAAAARAGEVVVLAPSVKIDAAKGLVKGEWSLPTGTSRAPSQFGFVRLAFNNEHSTFRSKSVKYRLAVKTAASGVAAGGVVVEDAAAGAAATKEEEG
jgi:hypothetical protein